MAYSLQQIALLGDVSGGSGVVRQSVAAQIAGNGGMPTTFSQLTFSVWLCNAFYTVGFGNQAFATSDPLTSLTGFDIAMRNDQVIIQAGNSGTAITNSAPVTFTQVVINAPVHVLLSLDTTAHVMHLYINDTHVPTPSGFWLASAAINNGGNYGGQWVTRVELGAPEPLGVGDLWLAPTFMDFSIAANRRKFIDDTGMPVDLGTNGALPTGTAPPIFLHIPPGGVATDFAHNYGTGGPWQITDQGVAVYIDEVCFEPTGPAPQLKLSIDNVVVQQASAASATPSCMISLEWSNDRGHSFGNPVSQPMGGTGEYGKTLTWRRLGYARDRVWKLQWSCPSATALLGAWIEVTPEGKGQG